jgi:hypothetical protein
MGDDPFTADLREILSKRPPTYFDPEAYAAKLGLASGVHAGLREEIKYITFVASTAPEHAKTAEIASELLYNQMHYTRLWKGYFISGIDLLLPDATAKEALRGVLTAEIGIVQVLTVRLDDYDLGSEEMLTNYINGELTPEQEQKERVPPEQEHISVANWIEEHPGAHLKEVALGCQMIVMSLLALGKDFSRAGGTALVTRLKAFEKVVELKEGILAASNLLTTEFLGRLNAFFNRCPKLRQFVTQHLITMAGKPGAFFGSETVAKYVVKIIEGAGQTHITHIEREIMQKNAFLLYHPDLREESERYVVFRKAVAPEIPLGFYKLLCGTNKEVGVSGRDLPMLTWLAIGIARGRGVVGIDKFQGPKITEQQMAIVNYITERINATDTVSNVTKYSMATGNYSGAFPQRAQRTMLASLNAPVNTVVPPTGRNAQA